MRVGVVRTAGSPCGCAEAVSEGLRALGHEPVVFDSEAVPLRAAEIAGTCDLVLDHTDTFRGSGLLRSAVRLLLERHGAALVGSGSSACALADDKAATKARLWEAGIPTPPGVTVTDEAWEPPAWLPYPAVLKPAFEHLSRGLALARSPHEARDRARDLLRRFAQPILAEAYVPGRELAVCVLEGPDGPDMLPCVEWAPGAEGVLTEAFKLSTPPRDRPDAGPAMLSTRASAQLRQLALQAFRALGLRDYGRFDVRLSPGGTFFFLEANATPSLEPEEALALSARLAGLGYPPLVGRLLAPALRRGVQRPPPAGPIRVDLPAGPVSLEVPDGVHPVAPSTVALAGALDVVPGERVLDLGCGAGLLTVAAALRGAAKVVAADLDPRALDATAANARANGVADRVELRAGSWFEALAPSERFDVIVATPPQTPAPHRFGPKGGGLDGTDHVLHVVREAPRFLASPASRLWLLNISLANPDAVWSALGEAFARVEVAAEVERPFTVAEYDALAPGLFDHLESLRAAGRCDFSDLGRGAHTFRCRILRATGARAP